MNTLKELMYTCQIPNEILDAARTLERWFAERDTKQWELFGVCSRNYAAKAESREAALRSIKGVHTRWCDGRITADKAVRLIENIAVGVWSNEESVVVPPVSFNPEDYAKSLDYATKLATFIWERNWKSESPNWQPLSDLFGLLTQIDNMVAGMKKKQADNAPDNSCSNDPVRHSQMLGQIASEVEQWCVNDQATTLDAVKYLKADWMRLKGIVEMNEIEKRLRS